MISEGYIQGDIGVMKSDFLFSIPTDSLARDAMRLAGDGQRVVLTYNEYKGAVLWRGNSKNVVTKIELDSMLLKPNPYKEAESKSKEKEEEKKE